MHYSDNDPALLETIIGKGRVLTMTMPVPVSASGEQEWSQFGTSFASWPYLVLSNEMLLYLAGSGEERLNYAAGDRVSLRLDPNQELTKFTLKNPQKEDVDLTADQKKGSIAVPNTATAAPGNYQVESGGTDSGVRRGFSTNIPAAATSLTRIKSDELTALLGAGRFKLAHGREEIDRSVSVGRVGRELYPLLIFLVALVLAGESLLSNRFYKRAAMPEPRVRYTEPPADLPPHPSELPRPAEPPPIPPTAPPPIEQMPAA